MERPFISLQGFLVRFVLAERSRGIDHASGEASSNAMALSANFSASAYFFSLF